MSAATAAGSAAAVAAAGPPRIDRDAWFNDKVTRDGTRIRARARGGRLYPYGGVNGTDWIYNAPETGPPLAPEGSVRAFPAPVSARDGRFLLVLGGVGVSKHNMGFTNQYYGLVASVAAALLLKRTLVLSEVWLSLKDNGHRPWADYLDIDVLKACFPYGVITLDEYKALQGGGDVDAGRQLNFETGLFVGVRSLKEHPWIKVETGAPLVAQPPDCCGDADEFLRAVKAAGVPSSQRLLVLSDLYVAGAAWHAPVLDGLDFAPSEGVAAAAHPSTATSRFAATGRAMCTQGLFVPAVYIRQLIDEWIRTDTGTPRLSSGYVAMHIRRGDFCTRNSNYRKRGVCLNLKEVGARLVRLMQEASIGTLYVLTDARKEVMPPIRQAVEAAKLRVLFSSDLPQALLERFGATHVTQLIMIDKAIAMMADVYWGNPASSFSFSIFHMRRNYIRGLARSRDTADVTMGAEARGPELSLDADRIYPDLDPYRFFADPTAAAKCSHGRRSHPWECQ